MDSFEENMMSTYTAYLFPVNINELNRKQLPSYGFIFLLNYPVKFIINCLQNLDKLLGRWLFLINFC